MAGRPAPLPFVTVFIPARNEERAIRECLGAVLAQDYPRDRFEVIVVDGASEDSTRAIVEEVATAADVPLRTLENPKRVIPAAVNRALEAAKGEYLIRVDAHSIPDPGYVRGAVSANIECDADLVGGWIRPQGTGATGRAVAAAFASPFGMGNPISWRRPAGPVEVASAPCGSFRVSSLAKIGGFDEEQLVNEDYEANYRLRQAGGRVMISPDVSFTYLPRETFGALALQLFRYGFYKARVIVKHPRSTRARHLVPPAGLVLYALLLALSPFSERALWPAVGLAGLYALGVIAASCSAGRGLGAAALLLPLVLATIHLSWALGNLAGLARWLPVRRSLAQGRPVFAP